MDISKVVGTIEEYWFEKIPAAIWKSACILAWIVFIAPFMAVGWASYKVWLGVKAGWVIARDL